MDDTRQAGGRRRVWAAVPFKGPVGSKRRLAGLLDADERARLSLAMLDGVLEALLGVAGIERVLLLMPAAGGTAIFAAPSNLGGQSLPRARRGDGRGPRGSQRDERLFVVDEHADLDGTAGRDNLNHALRQAQALAAEGGADALLIVPADLPLVGAEDLAALLDASVTASVVIAPDRAGDGTNALLLVPPTAITPGFGEASFGRHQALASAADLTQTVVERPGLRLDLDTPADVALLLASDSECRAARLLRELGAADRLDRLATAQARSTTI